MPEPTERIQLPDRVKTRRAADCGPRTRYDASRGSVIALSGAHIPAEDAGRLSHCESICVRRIQFLIATHSKTAASGFLWSETLERRVLAQTKPTEMAPSQTGANT